jgi:type I restriction enzyme S subunit
VVTDLQREPQAARLPSGWEVAALGDLGEALIGLTYDPACVASHGTLVLRSSNIQNDELSLEDNVFVQTPIPERLRTRPGDILICVRNGSASLIGKCLHLDESTEGETFGAFMAVFRSPEHRYVFHQFRSGQIKRQIGEQLGATINQITNASLRSFRIPCPQDPKERDAIADALDDVDSLIAWMRRMIVEKRDLALATRQDLLSGRRRLPGFTDPWTTWRLGDLFSPLPTANNSRADLSPDAAIGYLHYGDIHSLPGVRLNCSKVAIPRIAQDRVASYPSVQEGDLIVADASEDYAGLGKSAEITEVGAQKIVGGLHTIPFVVIPPELPWG